MSARPIPVNAASLFIARVVSAAIAVVVMSISAHRLDVQSFGVVASVLAAGFLANSLVTFGTDTVVTRSVAAGSGQAVAVALASLRLQLGAALVLFFASGLAIWLGAPRVVLLQAAILVPLAVLTVASAVLRGLQRMELLLWSSLGGAAVTLASLLLLFSVEVAAWVPIAAFGSGSTFAAIVAGAMAWVNLDDEMGGYPVGLLVRETAPFAVMVIVAAVGAQGGLLLVEFVGDEPTGGYGVALRITEAARLVPAAVMGAFFPAMLSGEHRTARYRQWLQAMYLYAVAATVAMLLLAGVINERVFDDQPDGAALIRILALGLALTITRLALSFEFIADGRERQVLISTCAGAATMLLGGAILAATIGAQGVAWAQLAGIAIAAAILILYRRTDHKVT